LFVLNRWYYEKSYPKNEATHGGTQDDSENNSEVAGTTSYLPSPHQFLLLITLRLNFNQVAMEGTGLTHVGQSLTGQLVSPAAGRKAGPVEALGH